jgi:rRNA-processing protein FCF1
MKAILEFDLPEEATEHLAATKAVALSAVIEELDNWLREQEKYAGKSEVGIAEARAKLRECCDDSGVGDLVFH